MKTLLISNNQSHEKYLQEAIPLFEFTKTASTWSGAIETLKQTIENERCDIIVSTVTPSREDAENMRQLLMEIKEIPLLQLQLQNKSKCCIEHCFFTSDNYGKKYIELGVIIKNICANIGCDNECVSLKIGDLEIQSLSRGVLRNGKSIPLTEIEYKILKHLIIRKNFVVSRQELSDNVFGSGKIPSSNVIDVHIASLRKKIDDEHEKKLIQSVHGEGYMISEE